MTRPFVLGLCVGLALVAGCKKKELPPADSPAPLIEDVGAPVTEAEALQYGERFCKAIESKNINQVLQMLRLEDMVVRSCSDLGLKSKDVDSVLRGLNNSGGTRKLAEQWTKEIGDGQLKTLRSRKQRDRTTALIRLIPEDGGVNYWELILVRRKNGEIQIEDMYLGVAGENVTQLLRRILVPMASAMNKGVNSPEATALLTKMDQMKALTEHIQNGRHDQAIQAHRTMPPETRKEKAVLVGMLQVFQDKDEAEYVKILEEFRKTYPNDPAIDLLSIDYYTIKKQFDQAEKCLRRLNESVGGDPYLKAILANLYLDRGDVAKAKTFAEEAIQEETTVSFIYDVLSRIALRQNDFVQASMRIKEMVTKTTSKIVFEDLEALPEFQPMTKSPQGAELKKWFESRKK